MLYFICPQETIFKNLEKGKLLERTGRKAVNLSLSGDEYGCLVAGTYIVLG